MPGFILNDGAVVPPSVYSAMNTVLNKKLGTSQVYPPRDWAAIVKDLVPLPLKSASGSIAHFEDGADTVPLKSLTYRFTPTQSGTGDPSPTNPRPINAVATANVVHLGKNYFDNSVYSSYEQADGSFLGTGSNFNTLFVYISPVLVGVEITFSASLKIPAGSTISNPRVSANVGGTNKNGNAVTSGDYTLSSVTFTPTSASDYVRITYGSGDAQALQFKEPQIELGSTPTAYEPFSSTAHPVDFGTVYGGEGNEAGEFANEFGIALDLSALSWTYQSADNRFVSTSLASLVKAPPNNSTVVENALCEIYKVDISNNTASSAYDNIIAVSSAGNLQIRDTSLSGDLDALATRLNGIKFVYPLATPSTLSVDPVAISSRLGVNNIYLDLEGSEIECEYYADPTLSTQ